MNDGDKYQLTRVAGWLQGELGSLTQLVMQICRTEMSEQQMKDAIEALITTCRDIDQDVTTIESVLKPYTDSAHS